MQLSFYSCLMAMIASSTMIVVIYFLKKTKYFANTFGVWFMALLYILSFFRLLVPVEIPSVQIVLGDSVVLPSVMDLLENRSELTAGLPCKAMYILGSISVVVTIVLLLTFFIRQLRFVLAILHTENHATENEQRMLSSISRRVFSRRTMMKLVKSDFVSVPMVVGVLRSVVVVPNKEYSFDELELILYHECTHLKNHDLWLKLLVHIYCCVFWFNPIVYLLKSDIDFILEVKCDNAVCRRLSEERKLDYAKLVNDSARGYQNRRDNAYLMTAGFASTNTSRHICRMNSMLKPFSTGLKLPTMVVSLIMAAICVLSYVFIWQPDYSNSDELNVTSSIVSDISYSELIPDDRYIEQVENSDYVFSRKQ